MDECKLTEQECIDFLVTTSKEHGEKAPRCVVMTRVQPERSQSRTVKFALVVTTNNIELIDALIRKCLGFNDDLFFIGSEINLQSDLEVEYLYFQAKIFPQELKV